MSFKDLGLAEPLLRAISKKGYDSPSTIQEKAIPLVLQGKDVLASAQTGTGKTAGFTLPMLQLLTQGKQLHGRPVRGLVLTPTRELAAQVYENVREYSEFVDIKSTVIFGGVSAKNQISAMRRGVDILVATPGRLLDLIQQREIDLSNVEILVLDEADRMLDMGFLRDIKRIIALVPAKRQNLLFSATFSSDIKKLAGSFLQNPILVEATPENSTAEKVIQTAFRVDKRDKNDFIIEMIKGDGWEQALVFTRTKHGANKLTEKMVKSNISAAAIHGNKSQGARTKALAGFKKGDIRILVATDIAARGLDIPLLPHVVNFELPNVAEDYVHRIGLTGRAGASGEAISLVAADEVEYLRSIEKLLGERLNLQIAKGYEPTDRPEDTKPAAAKQGQGGGQRPQRGNRPGGKPNSSGGFRKGPKKYGRRD
jgi:ATP-dependent RNA helicase RhlE